MLLIAGLVRQGGPEFLGGGRPETRAPLSLAIWVLAYLVPDSRGPGQPRMLQPSQDAGPVVEPHATNWFPPWRQNPCHGASSTQFIKDVLSWFNVLESDPASGVGMVVSLARDTHPVPGPKRMLPLSPGNSSGVRLHLQDMMSSFDILFPPRVLLYFVNADVLGYAKVMRATDSGWETRRRAVPVQERPVFVLMCVDTPRGSVPRTILWG